MKSAPVVIIGGGLAGTEAALQLATLGIPSELFEMRPSMPTPAHRTSQLGELVCSNSFGSLSEYSAPWLIKRELKELGAHLIRLAEESRVPAGHSLAIDRNVFSAKVTETVQCSPLIKVYRREMSEIPANRVVIIASGPLTSPSLARTLAATLGEEALYFYDAISPIVSADSLDRDQMFAQSRYDKGEADFLNIPLSQEQYQTFNADLLSGEVVLPHDFEEAHYFEACLPIEVLASRGERTLAFGPMKPVGLTDPRTGRRPYAVIQLRPENVHRSAYNLVGFQTKLKYGEQERIFRKLPGLQNVEFLRLGCMHRNTFIHSPKYLAPTLQLRSDGRVLVAGQLTGTEGYVESIATGCIAGINAAKFWRSEEGIVPPAESMLGSLLRWITDPSRECFQPTNSNMGLLPPLGRFRSKSERNRALCERAIRAFDDWKKTMDERASCTVLLPAPMDRLIKPADPDLPKICFPHPTTNP